MISVRHSQPLFAAGALVAPEGSDPSPSNDGARLKPACVLRKHRCGVRAALLPPLLHNHVAVQRGGGRCTDRTALCEETAPLVSHRCLAPHHALLWSPDQAPEQEKLR
jgi:hypothetical protein